eukprot:gene18444-24919_t
MPGVTTLHMFHRSATETASRLGSIVKIDAAAVEKLAGELKEKSSDIQAASNYMPLPIKFANLEAELSFMAVYRLLDMGSGWDALLQASAKRDAKETVHNFFGIESHVEKPLPNLPCVTVSEPGPLKPLSVAIEQLVTGAGQALSQVGQKSMGGLILSLLDSQKNSRKAQLLAADLFHRFQSEDARFNFSDATLLGPDSGSVLQPLLRAKGVLQYSDDLASKVDGGEELPCGSQDEVALRASVVSAVYALAEASGGVFSAHQLSQFLQLSGEDPTTRATFWASASSDTYCMIHVPSRGPL